MSCTDGFPKLRKGITPNRQEFTCGSMRGYTDRPGPVVGKLGGSRVEPRCCQGRVCVGSSWRWVLKQAEPVWVGLKRARRAQYSNAVVRIRMVGVAAANP